MKQWLVIQLLLCFDPDAWMRVEVSQDQCSSNLEPFSGKWKSKNPRLKLWELLLLRVDPDFLLTVGHWSTTDVGRPGIPINSLSPSSSGESRSNHSEHSEDDVSNEDISEDDFSTEDILDDDILDEDIMDDDVLNEDFSEAGFLNEDSSEEDVPDEDNPISWCSVGIPEKEGLKMYQHIQLLIFKTFIFLEDVEQALQLI